MSEPAGLERQLAAEASFRTAIEKVYRESDEAAAAHHPACIARGLCCRFEQFDHRLYLSSAEWAYLWSSDRFPPSGVVSRDGCPYQQGRLCTLRQHRPLGCRVFFCETRWRPFESPLHERFLRQLKGLAADFSLPYRYTEWLEGLRQRQAGR